MRLNFTLAQRVGYTVPECNEFKAMELFVSRPCELKRPWRSLKIPS